MPPLEFPPDDFSQVTKSRRNEFVGLTSQVRIYGLMSLEMCLMLILLNTGFDVRV